MVIKGLQNRSRANTYRQICESQEIRFDMTLPVLLWQQFEYLCFVLGSVHIVTQLFWNWFRKTVSDIKQMARLRYADLCRHSTTSRTALLANFCRCWFRHCRRDSTCKTKIYQQHSRNMCACIWYGNGVRRHRPNFPRRSSWWCFGRSPRIGRRLWSQNDDKNHNAATNIKLKFTSCECIYSFGSGSCL